jgi:hypothetical protein
MSPVSFLSVDGNLASVGDAARSNPDFSKTKKLSSKSKLQGARKKKKKGRERTQEFLFQGRRPPQYLNPQNQEWA